jgi:hypothetical protein
MPSRPTPPGARSWIESDDGIQIIDLQLLVRRRRLAFNFRERERGVISLQFKT